jgi:hypothetical protein
MKSSNEQEILQSIVKKAWKDQEFKSNLIASPVTTIEQFLGHSINLPEGKNIAVVDQSNASTIFINIPAEPNMEDMELNEEQLDVVAGGDKTPPVIIRPNNYDGNIFS